VTLVDRRLAALHIPANPLNTAAYHDLIARYEEPHREYHKLRHLTEVLDIVDELAAEAARLVRLTEKHAAEIVVLTS
jgi:predicted metal-dependent HD superfamily phosphohydrolase